MERSRIGNYLPVKRLTTGGPAFMHLFATRADEPNPDPEFFIKICLLYTSPSPRD